MSLRIDGAFIFGASIVFSTVINSLALSRRRKADCPKHATSIPAWLDTPTMEENPLTSNHKTKMGNKTTNVAKPVVSIVKSVVESEDIEVKATATEVTQPFIATNGPAEIDTRPDTVPNALTVSSAAVPSLSNKESDLFSAVGEEELAVSTSKIGSTAPYVEYKTPTAVAPIVISAPESSFSVSPSEDLDTSIDVDNDAVW